MELEEVRKIVEQKGYVFDGITQFKTKDRIKWHNDELKVNLSLGRKIRDITPEEFKQWVR